MPDTLDRALSHGRTIDITTTGRKSGLARRIEIVFHNFDGRIYVSGLPSPRKRAWLANLEADPHLTFHLKDRVATVDLPATARVISDEAERREVLRRVAAVWRRSDLEAMVRFSPLIEVTVAPIAATAQAG
jgi:deazaflavin-dependent oxidoreductase (nitroreductase family)